MDKEFQRQVDEILTNFDFNHVHRAMTLLNWKYSFPTKPDAVPPKKEIKHLAKSLLEYTATRPVRHITSGGFEVEKITTNRGSELMLSFVLESYTATAHTKD